MKRLFFLAIIVGLFVSGCSKLDIEEGTPKCVEKEIKDFNKIPYVCDNGANVNEYLFQGKAAYVFDPGNCGNDFSSEVIDADCNSLGFLGGIGGNIVINGEVFSNAIFIRTIWEK